MGKFRNTRNVISLVVNYDLTKNHVFEKLLSPVGKHKEYEAITKKNSFVTD